MIEVSAEGISFEFDEDIGQIGKLRIVDDGQEIDILHRAPWVGTGETMPDGTPPHIARLGGDFFCAPFAESDPGVPLHGWPANSAWEVADHRRGRLHARLRRKVRGAEVRKSLDLKDGHPFVYQRHTFRGGNGPIAVANHANVALPHGGLISASPKFGWATPPAPPEPDPVNGRSGLAYPALAADLTAFPGATGPVDLTRFPWLPRHEDVAVGLEAPGHDLGWTAVVRPAEGDLFLSLKAAATLPMTVLWQSNGGRDYPPWSGRHVGCLGVEEAAAADLLPSVSPRDLAGPGTLRLRVDGDVEVRHAIGAIRWPSGAAIHEVTYAAGTLRIRGATGATRHVPFWDGSVGSLA